MKKYAGVILQVLIGGACGAAGAVFGMHFLPELEGPIGLIVLGLSLIVSVYLHIILHEGGHLVCGLLSGYKFVSFRIGSVILIKIKDKYHLKRFNIPGTGGQCLLDPPEMVDGKYPAKLYNLGGGLSNLLFSTIGIILLVTVEYRLMPNLLLPFILLGFALGLTNLIPLKAGGIANDGYNLLSLDKDPVGSKALWQQLRVNKLQSDGIRLKDMEDGLFDLASSDVEGSPLVDQMKLFWMQRLMDENRFDEAEHWGKQLMQRKGLLDLFKNMINVELLYLELIGPCRADVVGIRYSKPLKKYLNLVKGYPSTHRLRYAYAVRFAHDDKMAAKAKADFKNVIKKYPMLGEIETEKELFERIKIKQNEDREVKP